MDSNQKPERYMAGEVGRRPTPSLLGSNAVAGVLDRAKPGPARFDEWDDWLDGDEHADSDADDDDD